MFRGFWNRHVHGEGGSAELESELHKLAEGPLRTMSSSDCKCLIESSAVEGKE